MGMSLYSYSQPTQPGANSTITQHGGHCEMRASPYIDLLHPEESLNSDALREAVPFSSRHIYTYAM